MHVYAMKILKNKSLNIQVTILKMLGYPLKAIPKNTFFKAPIKNTYS